MTSTNQIREQYAANEEVWRGAFRSGFDAILAKDGFNQLEFIYYAGIGPHEWVRICTRGSIANDPYVYAKIFYHLGLPEADPRLLPPRLQVNFGEVVTEKKRAIDKESYEAWTLAQKPPYSSLETNGVKVSEVNENLKILAQLISELVDGERSSRDEFVRTNGKMLRFVIPFLTALSMDGADRERELVRLITLKRMEI